MADAGLRHPSFGTVASSQAKAPGKPQGTANMSKAWSSLPIQQIRAALDDLLIAPDGFLHMKNIRGGFGKMGVLDLMAGKWIVRNSEAGTEWIYPTVDELILAGWAID